MRMTVCKNWHAHTAPQTPTNFKYINKLTYLYISLFLLKLIYEVSTPALFFSFIPLLSQTIRLGLFGSCLVDVYGSCFEPKVTNKTSLSIKRYMKTNPTQVLTKHSETWKQVKHENIGWCERTKYLIYNTANTFRSYIIFVQNITSLSK